MRVLLTGARGFIGRQVLDQLLRGGIETVVVGRTRPTAGCYQFIETDLIHSGVDVASIAGARATHLLHLAWYTEHGKFWSSPLNLRWLESSVQLVEAFCSSGGRQVVVAGTCAEYDWSAGYCREDYTPLKPATMYGVAKDATRRLVAAVCESYQVPITWGRIFLPYGPGEDSRRLIPSLFDVFTGRRAPFGVNAEAYRDFLHVNDVALAFVRLITTESSGCYNIASGEPIRISEVVRMIALACNADSNVVLNLPREKVGDTDFLIGENYKLKALGWRPRFKLNHELISARN